MKNNKRNRASEPPSPQTESAPAEPATGAGPSAAGDAAVHGQALLGFLSNRKDALSPLLILPHDFPDPDAIASAFALQHLAQSVFGIESRIAYGGLVGRTENRAMVRTLRIRMHRFHPGLLKRFPNVALVDTQAACDNNPFPANRKAAIVLDQHPSETRPGGGFVLVDPNCGATCVLMAQALLQSGADIPARVATARRIAVGQHHGERLSVTLEPHRVAVEHVRPVREWRDAAESARLAMRAQLAVGGVQGHERGVEGVFASVGVLPQNEMAKEITAEDR